MAPQTFLPPTSASSEPFPEEDAREEAWDLLHVNMLTGMQVTLMLKSKCFPLLTTKKEEIHVVLTQVSCRAMFLMHLLQCKALNLPFLPLNLLYLCCTFIWSRINVSKNHMLKEVDSNNNKDFSMK